jgi:hypothetical protein
MLAAWLLTFIFFQNLVTPEESHQDFVAVIMSLLKQSLERRSLVGGEIGHQELCLGDQEALIETIVI